jgi:hypothetical protein
MKRLLIVLLLVLLAAIQAAAEPTASTGEGLYPFTRRSNIQPVYGELVTLRILDHADTLPGNYGWLSWNGSDGTDDLAAALEPPGNAPEEYHNPGTPDNGWTPDHSDKAIAVGKWVQAMPGNKSGKAVRRWLDWHIDNQTPMVIPLYDAVAEQGGKAYYRVASFVAFELQSYDLTGQEKCLIGKFLRWVNNGPWVQ